MKKKKRKTKAKRQSICKSGSGRCNNKIEEIGIWVGFLEKDIDRKDFDAKYIEGGFPATFSMIMNNNKSLLWFRKNRK